MKYILFESPSDSVFPLMFPEHIGHDMVAVAMGQNYPGIKRISAGFCSFNGEEVSAWGESTTLRLKANPSEDAFWLGKALKRD